MDGDFLALRDAALASIAFDEKRDGIGGVEARGSEEEGEEAAQGEATRGRAGGFQRVKRSSRRVKVVKKAPL
jgi:hypothetical protein